MRKLLAILAVGWISVAIPTGSSAQTADPVWDNTDDIRLQGLDSPDLNTLINLGFTREGAFLAQNGRLTAPSSQTLNLADLGGAGTVRISVFGDTCIRLETFADAEDFYDFPGYSQLNSRVTIIAVNVRAQPPVPVGVSTFIQGASGESNPANCNRNYARSPRTPLPTPTRTPSCQCPSAHWPQIQTAPRSTSRPRPIR